jgi:anti-anti-sigma factor
MDVSNASQVGEELLSVINRGATALVVDMTATVSCDHAGAGAVVHAYRRALVTDARLRPVVTAEVVQRVLSLNGLDRPIRVYPSLETATAAAAPATTVPVTHEPAAPHAWQRRNLDRTTASGGKHEDP